VFLLSLTPLDLKDVRLRWQSRHRRNTLQSACLLLFLLLVSVHIDHEHFSIFFFGVRRLVGVWDGRRTRVDMLFAAEVFGMFGARLSQQLADKVLRLHLLQVLPLLQQMSFLMRCQVRTLRKPFTAIRIATHVRLFSRMRSQMSP